MANVELYIDDPSLRETVRLLLERAGHHVQDHGGDVLLAQSPRHARALMDRHRPVLMFAGVADVAEAVTVMRAGAFGYVLLPLQAGELELMVSRAAASGNALPPATPDAPAASGSAVPLPDATPSPLRHLEREAILAALKACGGNRSHAARRLGIGRNTLWRKMRAYGLAMPPGRHRKRGGGAPTP